MEDVVNVASRWGVVIEFLTAEGASPIGIHSLRIVYGEEAIDVSSFIIIIIITYCN